MTVAVLFTKLHSNPAIPMVINYHNCVPNCFPMLHKVFRFPRLYPKVDVTFFGCFFCQPRIFVEGLDALLCHSFVSTRTLPAFCHVLLL